MEHGCERRQLYAVLCALPRRNLGSADMGTAKNLSLTLPSGSAFYVAVKANNSGGASDFSNIGYFIVP